MYQITKYNWEDRNKHFWTSDFHIFHDPNWDVPIWKMRGYSSMQDAAESILEKVNSRVKENDILWYLGDGFLNAHDDQCIEWLNKLRCRNVKYLFGNHESVPYRLYKKEVQIQYEFDNIEIYPIRMRNLEFVGNHVEIRIGKKNIVMNHFPIHSWNGMSGRSSWMLSGHQHNADPTRNPDSPINRCLDVGWDWKKDVWSFSEIEDIMSTKTFVSYDHHR